MEEVVVKDSLGDRMKNYENVTRQYLIPKQPVIVRIDGRHFHSYVKQPWVKAPFDRNIILAFQSAAVKVCEEISNVQFAFHQSDEVSFFLKDYKSIEDQMIFKGNIQKIASIFASKFSNHFNSIISRLVREEYNNEFSVSFGEFDARVWNIPKEEVINYFVWRQRDWEKNSVTAYAIKLFSHEEVNLLHTNEKKEKIKTIGKDWDKLETFLKRGSAFKKVIIEQKIKELPEAAIKQHVKMNLMPEDTVERKKWVVDANPPRFEELKDYIETLVY